MSNTTVVTAFFDLSKMRDATTSTRDFNFYFKHGRFTLGVKTPMVIFCDSVTYPEIKKIREELLGIEQSNLLTRYIVKGLLEYDYYEQVFPHIVDYRKNLPGYQNPSNRNTPSYYLATMFKFHSLNIAYHANYFPKTTHYAWLDFGCGHILREPTKYIDTILASPKNKVSMGSIVFTPLKVIEDFHGYLANGGQCGTCGIFFTIERSYMRKFISYIFSVFYELLGHGYGHNDEQVVIYVVMRYPELFNLHFCDYYSGLANYFLPIEDIHSVLKFGLDRAIQYNEREYAKMIAKQLNQSVQEKRITLDEDNMNKVKFISQHY